MNQVMPAKTLDLKATKSGASSVKKKVKDDSFRKELDEKEKKTSHRDHLSANHHNNVEQRHSVKKNSEASKDALRSKVNEQKATEKGTTVNSKDIQNVADTAPQAEAQQTPAANQTPAQATPAAATAQAADTAVAPVEIDAAQLEALQKLQTLQSSAQGLSLEGMTLVNPEAVNINLTEQAEAPVAATMTTETSAAMAQVAGIEGKSLEADLGGSGENLSDLTSEQLSDALNSALQAGTKDKAAGFEAIMKQAAAAPTEAAREANVNNMVQSAQTLIKDGGGEMKIVLTPEGMGTVDLKVAVQDNVVNIEVMTEDKHVKKMFEDGIADIRSALELQNLKMDTFKVDMSERSQLNTADQQQENANREFARDFMNQFRGERQAFRNQSMGYDLERSPNMSKSPEGLRPAQNNSVAGNGRLNIVA